MEKELQTLADKVLKFLCIGSKIEGINFYGLRILLSESEENNVRIDGQIIMYPKGWTQDLKNKIITL